MNQQSKQRAFNFSAGPAQLPEPVLLEIQRDLLDWQGLGVSVMEVSHRSRWFLTLVESLKAELRDLLCIPSHYDALFMQGGGTAQFSAVPMNLIQDKAHQSALYLKTGHWSEKAAAHAARYCKTSILKATSGQVPQQSDILGALEPSTAYVHYTPNETVQGVAFHHVPETSGIPLVGDFSSCILSEPIDIERHAIIYACAQKNIGPSGFTLVIIRKDLIPATLEHHTIPQLYCYSEYSNTDSMPNTPVTFSWYVASLVLKWITKQGGLEAMKAKMLSKANKLYAYIDAQTFYQNNIDQAFRSNINIPFSLLNTDLNAVFLKQAEKTGILNIAGHRIVGGMRASLYNAVTEESVDALIDFMDRFAACHY